MSKFEEIKSNINLINTKNYYIIKTIFSYLSEKQKLNMIIYNKELQKILSVNIENYQTISGKLKIGEKNGKVREYSLDTSKLIFEGDYFKW